MLIANARGQPAIGFTFDGRVKLVLSRNPSILTVHDYRIRYYEHGWPLRWLARNGSLTGFREDLRADDWWAKEYFDDIGVDINALLRDYETRDDVLASHWPTDNAEWLRFNRTNLIANGFVALLMIAGAWFLGGVFPQGRRRV